jgi:hypothetical protein
MALASSDAPSVLLRAMAALGMPRANVTVTLAMMPFRITLALIPARMHPYEPLTTDAHVSVLPAASALAPATAATEEISADAYASVHCSPAGSLPDVEVNAIFRTAVSPELIVADESASVPA